ncbi:MAG TPA: hypothetical protein VFS26_06275 [Solirubrobacterales bacterium]|nr:hypothetical protein [Solirubrobacterales bacterium]
MVVMVPSESWSDERLDYFEKRVEERFDRIDKRFEQVDKRFERIEKRLERVETIMVSGFIGLAGLIVSGQILF